MLIFGVCFLLHFLKLSGVNGYCVVTLSNIIGMAFVRGKIIYRYTDMYKHAYFSIFMMIPLLLMLVTAGHMQNMCCVSMNNNQTNLFGNLYHFTFLLQQTNMNPSSHCRTSIFEEEFKFQYVREEIHIHIATKHHFDIFVKVVLCLVV